MRRLLLLLPLSLATVLLPVVGAATPPGAAPEAAPGAASRAGSGSTVWRGSFREAVTELRVRREVRDGYDRDLFDHWTYQGDGCDTRDLVLVQESRDEPVVGEDCAVSGRWVSAYDGVETTDPSTFDIDHLVPLAEAWDSGARTWDDTRREEFANDLGDRRSLIAVTASSNRSKSDQDPAEWMPDRLRCRYVRQYTAVKLRWGLDVDRTEKRSLRRKARRCAEARIRVTVLPAG